MATDILQEMILDSQQAALPQSVPRRLRIVSVPGKATVCMGVRRSGKTTLMHQLMAQHLHDGVPRENMLHLNFFDDRLPRLDRHSLSLVHEAYYLLYPAKKDTEQVYFFFDEIQGIPGWEHFVDRLMRTEKCQVYITGSSAKMLSSEIATQMRGRSLSWEVFPFSFREFLDARGVAGDGALSTGKRLAVQHAFEDYWKTGGFPEVVQAPPDLQRRIHQEYFNAVVFRDLVERHNIPHPNAVRDLAHRLIDSVSSFYSLNGLTGYLHDIGHKAPKDAVKSYLAWFEDAYAMFSVRRHDASLKRANASPKKVYCIDHALVRSISSGVLRNTGRLLENLVFIALRRLTPTIAYYRTGAGKEVDFIAQWPDRRRMLVQVCESMAEPQTRKREVAALAAAMAEQGLAEGTVVTRSEKTQIAVDAGVIRVVPAWAFLLSLPDSVS